MNVWRLGLVAATAWVAGTVGAQAPVFTRPGSMIVVEAKGEVRVVADGRERVPKAEERLRAEVTFRTGRQSTVTVEFANGSRLRLGSDTELTVPEFWQLPHSRTGKMAEWKEEPSPSRTKLALVRGDAQLTVKPLLTARGSSLTLETNAGTVTIDEGVLRARVQSTEVGIGLCTLELENGRAELERVGGTTAPMPVGRAWVLAVEVDRRTGAVTVSDAPRPEGTAR
jgi:hypothetical protein